MGDLSPNVLSDLGVEDPSVGQPGDGWVKPSPGQVSKACPPRTISATGANTSTSPWPSCSWPAFSSSGRTAPCARQVGFLARLLQAAEAGERAGSVVEILVLQALTHQLQGDIPAAIALLARALALGGSPRAMSACLWTRAYRMAQLLQAAAQAGIAPDYVAQLLDAVGTNAK